MRQGNAIVHLPLLLGIALSIAAHAVAFYVRGESEPARMELEAGRTVVQLTLLPSAAAEAVPAEPEPEPVVEPEPTPEPVVEPEPIPAPTPEPIPQALPEPVVETAAVEVVPEPTVEPATVESVEQNASELADKGVEIEAAPTTKIRATYPRSAQKRGQEGTVVLAIQVNAAGSASDVKILKSSGHKILDSAAVKAARKAKYAPAKRFGRAVASELIQPIVFKLDS